MLRGWDYPAWLGGESRRVNRVKAAGRGRAELLPDPKKSLGVLGKVDLESPRGGRGAPALAVTSSPRVILLPGCAPGTALMEGSC